MKRFYAPLMLVCSLYGDSVTVYDAETAYAKQQAAIIKYIAEIKEATKEQEKINRDLQLQVNSMVPLNSATLYNIQQYKILSGVTGSYVDLQAVKVKAKMLLNEADTLNTKTTNFIILQDDIKKSGLNF